MLFMTEGVFLLLLVRELPIFREIIRRSDANEWSKLESKFLLRLPEFDKYYALKEKWSHFDLKS